MKITITKNEKEFDCTAAWRIIGQMLNEPESVIGLSTGRTTGNLHRLVGEIYTKYPFKVDTVTFFGLDEVTNVPREYAGACYTMLKTELMDTLGIKEENFLMLPTISGDFEQSCRDFQQEIANRGGIDLLILELGGATLGIKNIMQARRIVLVAKGTNKADIVKRMLEGPVTTDVPASILQLHPNCEFLLDEAAASMLNC